MVSLPFALCEITCKKRTTIELLTDCYSVFSEYYSPFFLFNFIQCATVAFGANIENSIKSRVARETARQHGSDLMLNKFLRSNRLANSLHFSAIWRNELKEKTQLQFHQQRTNENNNNTYMRSAGWHETANKWNARLFNVTVHNAHRVHTSSSAASQIHTRTRTRHRTNDHWLPWNDHTGSTVTVIVPVAFRRRRSWIIYCITLFIHKFLHINFYAFLTECYESEFASKRATNMSRVPSVCLFVRCIRGN